MTRITSYELRRIRCPLGRMIGDSGCSYDEVLVTELTLITDAGHRASGFAHAAPAARYLRPAWWFHAVPSLDQFRQSFATSWWPCLESVAVDDQLDAIRRTTRSGSFDLDRATRLALWDMQAVVRGLPLYALLGGTRDRKQAYGSPLEFPLDDADAARMITRLLAGGVTQLKLKVGAEDPRRDIARLQLARALAGPGVPLTADANEAWDAATTLDRLERFEAAGVGLAYIEDPIDHNALGEIEALTRRCPIPVAGNDYVTMSSDMRRMLDAGIGVIRANNDIDYMLDCVALAREYDVPMAIGNSPFETSAHFAAAFDEVAIIEFADLGWNVPVTNPAHLVAGQLVAPGAGRPGHGVAFEGEIAA